MLPSDAALESLPPWIEFFTFRSANVLYVLIGSVVLSIAAALIGSFAYLRKQSLIGDALAHAALPGVCMAFLLTGTKNPLVILLGATVSCWLGALSVEFITRYTRCKEDSALGIVLSVYFGVGIVLLTWIQKTGAAAQAGLDKFLFGQAAAMVQEDVIVISAVGILICGLVVLGYKELKLISFDGDFAAAIGMPRRTIEIALATMIVLAVAIGLQAVGVVLMAALLVTPAAAARYWTERLWVMLVIAAGIGAAGGFLGAYISYLSPQMPTGPWMVIAVTTLFLISFLCAPARGVFARVRRLYRNRRRTARENVLRTFYVLGEHYDQRDHWFTTADILIHRSMPPRLLGLALRHLKRKGYVEENEEGLFRLTPTGQFRAARLTRLHRLWEVYLTRKLEIAPDHVHDDAEEVEHIITPEMEERLSAILDHPDRDPHERYIPARDYMPVEEGS